MSDGWAYFLEKFSRIKDGICCRRMTESLLRSCSSMMHILEERNVLS